MKSLIILFVLCFMKFISYSQITITPNGIYGGCSSSGCSGSASFTVTGGTAPYTYTFSSPATVMTDTSGYVFAYSLCPGTHTLISADQNSVTTSFTFSIVHSPPLSAVVNTTNTSCGLCNGAINITGSGGIPPYYFSHVYGPAAPIPVTMPMNNLCSDIYNINVIDNNGCSIQKTITLMSTPTLTGSIANLNVANASCTNSYDGTISVGLSGSNPGPFTYSWTPYGQNTQSIVGGVGIYMVTVYDASMNCITLIDTIKSNYGPCGTVSGNIFIDNNSDCIKNSGDINCQTAGVVANPGNRIGYTNLQGNYYIDKLPYGTYTITPDNYSNSVLGTCATSIIVSVNGSNPYPSGNDFPVGYTSLSQPDIQVSAYSNGIVPGFNCYINYSLCNLNNVPVNGIYKAILPPGIMSTTVSISPTTYTVSGDTIIWNYTNISNSGGCVNYIVYFTTPISATLGSLFTTCVNATNSITDFDASNNYLCYDKIVTGSFDPNDKSVSPVGNGPNGNITVNEKELTYFIRFQNTGNGPANTVTVSDSISPFLDPTTFQMLGASHNYDIEITPGKVIRWDFYNIMLPDSNSNEPASHGYIHYKIKQKANNPIGSKIKNTAYIYFDFNPPVITNTTINTIDISTGIKNNIDYPQLNLIPNPTNGLINLTSNNDIDKIELLNITGQILLSTTVREKDYQINLDGFSEGVYFVKVMQSNGLCITKKVILFH